MSILNTFWIPAFAGMTMVAACSSPAPQPYRLTTPTAQTGPQHILLGQAIDINTADAATLEALPGIGPALAQRIVADREARGPFRSLQDLDRVPGIGPKSLERLSPLLHP